MRSACRYTAASDLRRDTRSICLVGIAAGMWDQRTLRGWPVRVRPVWRCAERVSCVLSAGLWTPVELFGRYCWRGRKTRLQFRSSLTTSAKKLFGKQRLTCLVQVSFPAPYSPGKAKLLSPFGFQAKVSSRRVSKAVMQRIANPFRSVRLRYAPPIKSPRNPALEPGFSIPAPAREPWWRWGHAPSASREAV